ncbi:MAG: transglutaminase domain-containing protein [Planctomycetota bacterium]|nr:transglutaminase domain-containing protein [Planctomycetota bacterium]
MSNGLLSLRRPAAWLLLLAIAFGVGGCGDDPAPKPPGKATLPDEPGPAVATVPETDAPSVAGSGGAAETEVLDTPPKVVPTTPKGHTERWYEVESRGQKAGYFQVVWSPSTWEGKQTLHDTTTRVTRRMRDMMGHKDVFESTLTIDLERSEDGTLWSQRLRVEEAGRVTIEELTWNGAGYDHVARIQGEKDRTKTIAAETPVMTDSESFLGYLLRQGKLEIGQTYDLPQLDVRAEKVKHTKLEVVAREYIDDENGKSILCFKIHEVNPEAKSESFMWLDDQGAFVLIKAEGSQVIRRVTAQAARRMPARPVTMRITTPSRPSLERIMSADRHLVDVHLRADPDRKLPEFPDSPWSKPLKVTGGDKAGWVIEVECKKYDSEEKTATIPVTDEAFAKDLEPTVLMQSEDPRVQRIAKQVVGDETDARKAAYKLARYVTENLRKQSPPVGQASAVQILEMRCGDCSEHCLLFTTLCRAAGIPARRCSGYVNIGSNWGAHAWCEIWTGQWIGADPTTGEVGCGARYLFFGYSDRPNSYPGVVSARIQDRIRFVSRRIEEGKASYDLTNDDDWRRYDPENGRYVHVLAGLEAREVPSSWRVQFSGSGFMRIRGDDFEAQVSAYADQGQTLEMLKRRFGPRAVETTFAGAEGIVQSRGGARFYLLHSRRRIVQMQVRSGDADALAMLEKVLRPTFAETPPAWD